MYFFWKTEKINKYYLMSNLRNFESNINDILGWNNLPCRYKIAKLCQYMYNYWTWFYILCNLPKTEKFWASNLRNISIHFEIKTENLGIPYTWVQPRQHHPNNLVSFYAITEPLPLPLIPPTDTSFCLYSLSFLGIEKHCF